MSNSYWPAIPGVILVAVKLPFPMGAGYMQAVFDAGRVRDGAARVQSRTINGLSMRATRPS